MWMYFRELLVQQVDDITFLNFLQKITKITKKLRKVVEKHLDVFLMHIAHRSLSHTPQVQNRQLCHSRFHPTPFF
jgi:hypothetical protein